MITAADCKPRGVFRPLKASGPERMVAGNEAAALEVEESAESCDLSCQALTGLVF